MYIWIIIVLLIVLGAGTVYRHKVFYHFGIVERGKLYRSGVLSGLGMRSVCPRYKIRTIINLTSPREYEGKSWYQRELQYCREHNIKLIHIPIKPAVAPNDEQIRRFLNICHMEKSQPILVHCKQGVARTGMMIAIYLKHRYRWDNQQILHKLPTFGHDFHRKRYEFFRDFILGYESDE